MIELKMIGEDEEKSPLWFFVSNPLYTRTRFWYTMGVVSDRGSNEPRGSNETNQASNQSCDWCMRMSHGQLFAQANLIFENWMLI